MKWLKYIIIIYLISLLYTPLWCIPLSILVFGIIWVSLKDYLFKEEEVQKQKIKLEKGNKQQEEERKRKEEEHRRWLEELERQRLEQERINDSAFNAREEGDIFHVNGIGTVYFVRNGKRYHRIKSCPCLAHSGTLYYSSLLDAKQDKTACNICFQSYK